MKLQDISGTVEAKEKPTVASPIKPVVSGDCATTLLKEFDLYNQGDSDYIGSPFRERVLNVIGNNNLQSRVLLDCTEEEGKIDELIDFMHGNIYPTLTPVVQGLLMVQLSHMKSYAGVLRDRVEILQQEEFSNSEFDIGN